MQFEIHEKNKEGYFEITCACSGSNLGRKSKFQIRYDTEDEKVAREEALPRELARHLSKFRKEDFEKNPDDVVNTALRMIEGKNNIHANIIMKMDKPLPTKKEFGETLN